MKKYLIIITILAISFAGVSYSTSSTIKSIKVDKDHEATAYIAGSSSKKLPIMLETKVNTTISNLNPTPIACELLFKRYGNQCSISLTTTVAYATKTNTSNPSFASGIPNDFVPSVDWNIPILIRNNSLYVTGFLLATTGGALQVRRENLATWTASAQADVVAFTAHYDCE